VAIDLKRYNALKERADEAKRAADKAAGVLDQLKAQIKEEFGCDTIKEARILLASLTEQQDKAEQAFAEKLAAFEQEFGEVLK